MKNMYLYVGPGAFAVGKYFNSIVLLISNWLHVRVGPNLFRLREHKRITPTRNSMKILREIFLVYLHIFMCLIGATRQKNSFTFFLHCHSSPPSRWYYFGNDNIVCLTTFGREFALALECLTLKK